MCFPLCPFARVLITPQRYIFFLTSFFLTSTKLFLLLQSFLSHGIIHAILSFIMAKDPSKTEQATPKKLQETRKKGNVPRSQEASKTMTVFAGTTALFFYIGQINKQLQEALYYFLGNLHTFSLTSETIYSLAFQIGKRIAFLILPVLVFIALVGFLTARLQVGKLWTTQVFKFKWEQFNLIKGVQRMFFTLDSFVRLGKSIVQAIIIGIAPYIVLKNKYQEFIITYHATPHQIGAFILDTAFTMMQYTLIPMFILMIVDIVYTRYKYNENIKMTKQEVKDEYKQMEGDTTLKQKMRTKMRDMIGKKVEQLIPTADVIITNPTHYAIALKYDASLAPAPIVIAKGKGYRARKIKELAMLHGIPLRENKPLAQALYKTLEVGDVIPEEMYHAVALILSTLTKFKKPQVQTS